MIRLAPSIVGFGREAIQTGFTLLQNKFSHSLNGITIGIKVMEVWIAEWSDSDNCVDIVVFGSEHDALSKSVKDIKQIIAGWTPGDDENKDLCAQVINDFARQGFLDQVITYWNDYQGDEEYYQYCHVYSRPVLGDISASKVSVSTYQTEISGATCRKCNATNEYAYADQPDGTFVCYSCKAFGG